MDAVVVGAGPNGLAAAIELARAGRSVMVIEAQPTIGGGTRTAELTLPGYQHDVCSAVHPLVVGSPYLRTLPLERFGLELVSPSIQAAHPLDDGSAVTLHRSLRHTADGLGIDAAAYASLIGPFARDWEQLAPVVLGPARMPRHPLVAARFARVAVRPAASVARARFRSPAARAFLAGMAAHSMLPLTAPATAAFGLVLLTLGHAAGWPVARGGSQAISAAMRAYLESLGGVIETGREVTSMGDVPSAEVVLFDLTPRQLLAICGEELPPRFRSALARYRYGPGVFKVDYALDAPVPWRAEQCRSAGTVHVGGTFEEIADSEQTVMRGRHHQRPFVLVAQPSIIDSSRAPAGRHTLWAYCHVPNGSDIDMTDAIEGQIERFAPGFADRVLARATRSPTQLEADNANLVGGDINGGLASLRQIIGRPTLRFCPYATPNPKIFLCSSSTPPGGGVHGMCGYHAARAALTRALR